MNVFGKAGAPPYKRIRFSEFVCHPMAVRRSQLSQSFLMKMLHQILPIGTLIHKYDPVKYTIGCPTCRKHNETYDHLFQCHHPSCVGWRAQLKATLIMFIDDTDSDHLLQDILVTGIHSKHVSKAWRGVDMPRVQLCSHRGVPVQISA
jgi:hypothetical protein